MFYITMLSCTNNYLHYEILKWVVHTKCAPTKITRYTVDKLALQYDTYLIVLSSLPVANISCDGWLARAHNSPSE